ncbi:MAG: DUF192 domain-containing protein [Actinomycetota bacterium]
MRRRILPFVPFLLLAACGGVSDPSGQCEPGAATYPLWFGPGRDRERIEVQIANDDAERARGLMGRTELGAREGMVFLHEEPTRTGFWMKGTSIPLTVAFWGTDGRISEIVDLEPCEDDPCPVSTPAQEYIGAVEVARGNLERLGVEVGDRVDLGFGCA